MLSPNTCHQCPMLQSTSISVFNAIMPSSAVARKSWHRSKQPRLESSWWETSVSHDGLSTCTMFNLELGVHFKPECATTCCSCKNIVLPVQMKYLCLGRSGISSNILQHKLTWMTKSNWKTDLNLKFYQNFQIFANDELFFINVLHDCLPLKRFR